MVERLARSQNSEYLIPASLPQDGGRVGDSLFDQRQSVARVAPPAKRGLCVEAVNERVYHRR